MLCGVQDGFVATTGLHGAILEYQRRGMALLERARPGVNSSSVSASDNATLQFMSDLASQYLDCGLQYSSQIVLHDFRALFESYKAWLVGLSVRSRSFPVMCLCCFR